MARTRARRSAALVTGLACLVALAGCNSNPSPAPLPSSSPSATPSESPSLTPPTMPAEAQGTSEASAKAFVRYYIDVLNFAGSTGDTAELKQISHVDCTSCQGVISSIDRVYSDGGRYTGSGWSVETIKYQPFQPRKKPVLTVGVDIAPQEVLEKRGGKTTPFDGGNRSMTFRLGVAENDWTLLQLDQPG